jgi:ABC-type Na+ transport system ATPase subunit NatA
LSCRIEESECDRGREPDQVHGILAAIEDVSFTVQEGEILGFLGPDAAGKTITMRILTGFMPPSSGKARVAGFDVFEDSLEVRKRIGYMPETAPLYPEMTVSSYLNFVARIREIDDRRERIADIMDTCDIAQYADTLIGKLSKGYRQRVGLAQALVHDPQVLVLDEPTIGLDPKQIVEVRQLIKRLGGDHTVILSTHILPEVAQVCGRVVCGDSDFAANSSLTLGGNGDLFLNSVNWLAEEEELISIRPKPPVSRMLILSPGEARFVQYSSVVLLPLAVLAVGTVVCWRRR